VAFCPLRPRIKCSLRGGTGSYRWISTVFVVPEEPVVQDESRAARVRAGKPEDPDAGPSRRRAGRDIVKRRSCKAATLACDIEAEMSYFERIGAHRLWPGGRAHRPPSSPTLDRQSGPATRRTEPPSEALDEQTNDTLPMVHLEDTEPSSLPLPLRATGLEGASSRTFVDR
jgi:hypothetical protein